MTRQAQLKAPLWKSVLAWVGLGFGAISVLAAFGQPGVSAVAGAVLFGLALLIPSAWWMWCQSRDSRIAGENADLAASYEQMRRYLTPADVQYADALDSAPTIPATKRHWKVVAPASVAALVAGAMLLPDAETPAPAGLVGPQPSSSQAPPPPSSTSSSRPTAEPTSSPVAEPPTPVTEVEQAPAAPEPTRDRYPAPAEPEPAPAPARAVAPPPDGGGGVYFANCTEAKAAGAAPIYAGSPGYRSALDRDGDGVACET